MGHLGSRSIETDNPRDAGPFVGRIMEQEMYAYLKARKEGCSLLALACLLLIGWMRSLLVTDEYVTFGQFEGTRSKIAFYRSSDSSIRYMWRVASKENIREKQVWSIDYAVLTIPVTLAAGHLILWPLRKPMPIADWVAVVIISIVLFVILL